MTITALLGRVRSASWNFEKVSTTSLLGTIAVLLATTLYGMSSAAPVLSPPEVFFSPNGAVDLVAGDSNNDGHPDLMVVGDFFAVDILLGDGDGSFSAFSQAISGSRASFRTRSIARSDLNGDGLIDLVALNQSWPDNAPDNSATVFLGNGNGTFGVGPFTYPDGEWWFGTNVPTQMGPSGIVIDDTTGDGIADLVVANSGPGTVSVIVGNGDGTFKQRKSYGVGQSPQDVGVGDLNGDGRLDVVTVDTGDGTVSVLLGVGSGGALKSRVKYVVSRNPQAVAVADLNADGHLDLAVACLSPGAVSVLLGTGDGTFGESLNFPVIAIPQALAVGDLDEDGTLDIAVATDFQPFAATVPSTSGRVAVLSGNGDGTFGPQTILPTGTGAYSVVIEDWNADGHLDLAIAGGADEWGSFAGLVTVFLNLGGTSAPASSVQKRATPNSLVEPRLTAAVSSNPLNPTATLALSLKHGATVRARLFDISGRLVCTLLDGAYLPAGRHEVTIDGRDEAGRRLASGVYLYRIESSAGAVQGRVTILK